MNRDQHEVEIVRKRLSNTAYILTHPADTIAYIFQELGEVSKEMLRLGYGAGDSYAFYDHGTHPPSHDCLKVEFGDTMLMLCTLANQLGVDLSEALDMSIQKILNRWEKT